MIEITIIAALAIIGMTYLNVRKDKQLTEALKLLASRNYVEYARGKSIEEKPVITAEDRARISLEERIREADADPYSQA